MTDDIVTRLREQVELAKPSFPQIYLVEAADEIEYLRIRASFFQEVAHQLWKDFPEDEDCCGIRLYEIYNKRGAVPSSDEEKFTWLKEDEKDYE